MSTLFPLVLLSGCVTAKIDSQRDESFNKEIERVYVYSDFGMEDQELATHFSNAIYAELSVFGIDVRMDQTDPLALEAQRDGKIAEAVAEFNPTVVLELTQTERGTSVTPGAPGMPGSMSKEAGYDASLYDAESMQRVWRARVSTSGDATFTNSETTAMKLAATLTKRLKEDGLISE